MNDRLDSQATAWLVAAICGVLATRGGKTTGIEAADQRVDLRQLR